MANLFPKAERPSAVPDPNDAANRLNNQRARRIAGSGRNDTFLGASVEAAQAAAKPTATLTGLNGS